VTASTQQLVLDRVESGIEARTDVVLTHDRHYANTGTLRTLDAETLEQIAALGYDFQPGYCHFRLPGTATTIACHWYGQPRSPGAGPAMCGSLAELSTAVINYLTERKQ
jgi:hypothetical protein